MDRLPAGEEDVRALIKRRAKMRRRERAMDERWWKLKEAIEASRQERFKLEARIVKLGVNIYHPKYFRKGTS